MPSIPSVVTRTFKNWRRHRVSRLGAALAFYTVFSLAPLLFMVVVITGVVLGAAHTQHLVEEQLRLIVGDRGAQVVNSLVSGSQSKGDAAAVALGALLVLVSAFGIFVQVQDALDEIWEVPRDQRGGIRQTILLRLHALVVVAVLALLAMIALITADSAGSIVGAAVNVVALFVFLAITYRVLPKPDVGWKSSMLGAAITGAILLIGEVAISLYFTRMHPEARYGTLGAFVVVLLWIYYSTQLLLFGAELTKTIETTH